jgi:hypothetical protein
MLPNHHRHSNEQQEAHKYLEEQLRIHQQQEQEHEQR